MVIDKIFQVQSDELRSSDVIERYRDLGIVIVKNAVPKELIEEVENKLRQFFESVLKQHGIEFDLGMSLDDIHSLVERSLAPERSKYLLTIGKDLPVFKKLISSDFVMRWVYALLGTENIQSADDSNVLRIDRPNSEVTNLPWHQDYPYNMLSLNAITAWIPILPVERDMGRMRVVIPKSELLPVEYNHQIKKQFHNSRYIKLKNLDTLEKQLEDSSIELQEVSPGDMVLFDALLLHRSGANCSEKSRWVATARYGSLDDNFLAQRNYFTARAKYPDIFKYHHPDYWFEVN
ncbi:phytanoyl-CoA dioxygenase family protein [Pseudoalteromonas piscicida]|uniref:phytanoyl-CoA dioxygenase family protein n=1 Tax=Pseudoalteromonas piscicida TaxID=43662 RepID=UPI0027E42246|nr:phytanoyl-CoA dioxygenase family protein [Pseudoalteromonas piscicida]WMO14137.1 phytanoyl-CoA dioxygenase family protein [Pseudoalteromonas piscicida]